MVEGTSVEIPYQSIGSLPPLPKPNKSKMRCEFAGGATLVLTVTGILLSVMHLIHPSTLWLTTIWSIAAFALACLLGLAFLDPGVVNRNDKTCFPLPEDIAAAMKTG